MRRVLALMAVLAFTGCGGTDDDPVAERAALTLDDFPAQAGWTTNRPEDGLGIIQGLKTHEHGLLDRLTRKSAERVAQHVS